MGKTLIRLSILFAAVAGGAPGFAQNDGSSPQPPCLPDDIPCQIIRMSPKPGGGGGGGITDGHRLDLEIEKFRMDLGVERVPSEQMRLPELNQFQIAPIQ